VIIKLKKDIKDLKIGLFGTRRKFLAEVLVNKNIKFVEIEHVSDLNTNCDVVFASGVYSLIKEKYLNHPTYGIIGFHETPLPEGRGNAPIQWTIENKRSNLTITALKFVKEMDAGDYVYQYNVPISISDTLVELEEKRKTGVQKCFTAIIDEMEKGYLVTREQTGSLSISPKRTPPDSELDVNKTLIDLWDKIRICDNEKFPAFFWVNKKKIILKYEVEN
jgi:methionyl-tRNA formyltransferase